MGNSKSSNSALDIAICIENSTFSPGHDTLAGVVYINAKDTIPSDNVFITFKG
jgi:hypothetical protein